MRKISGLQAFVRFQINYANYFNAELIDNVITAISLILELLG